MDKRRGREEKRRIKRVYIGSVYPRGLCVGDWRGERKRGEGEARGCCVGD